MCGPRGRCAMAGRSSVTRERLIVHRFLPERGLPLIQLTRPLLPFPPALCSRLGILAVMGWWAAASGHRVM